MKHILNVLVQDRSGVLVRVAGLFSRRGYNIESLTVGADVAARAGQQGGPGGDYAPV